MNFPKNSAFHLAQQKAQQHMAVGAEIREAIDKMSERQDREHVKEAVRDLPLDHWHHDLETIDILLEQHPPDVGRARDLIRDIRQEIYRELK